jgi:tetratricopeptide (TPR) repeat protein
MSPNLGSLCWVLLYLLAWPIHAQDIPVHECDRLAAHPGDNNKVTPGVSWEQLETERALAACERAIEEHPEVSRFTYQYARALHKAGALENAAGRYRSVAEKGYAQAQAAISSMYLKGEGIAQDSAEAFRWCRNAADLGHAGGQSMLGVMYLIGEGVEQDYVEAVNWLRKAADQGAPNAQFMLGVMYTNGEGVPKDEAKAVEWYRKAAEQGLPDAQHELGRMYFGGRGVAQDKVQAYVWVSLAAARRHIPSRDRIDSLAAEMTAAQITEAQRIAWEWEKAHAAPLSPIDFKPESSFVIIDQSDSAYTVFTGIPDEVPENELEEIRSMVAEQEEAVLITWSEFLENARKLANATIVKHEYLKYGVVDGIVCLVGKTPGAPWGLTWNGGIALTLMDYRHAREIYLLYSEDPEEYEEEVKRDPRADPISPGGHLPAFGCL